MAEQHVINPLRENLDAFNVGDTNRFGATLADDAVYDEQGTQGMVQNRDEVFKVTFGWRQAFPDAHSAIQNIFGSGNQAVAEIVWEGTHSGDMPGPGGPISATGKRVHVPANMVVTTEGGKLKETHHYFDMMTMLQRLGVSG